MISAIVLSHNDEDRLTQCLSSLSWCDEVLVIDDQSQDGTVEIAKKFGAKVYVRALNDDFAAQRNFGLSKTKGPASTRGGSSTRGGDWVLFIDSDEAVSPQLANEITQAVKISNLKSQVSNEGFFIKRKDSVFGRWLGHGETASVRLLRLAKKNAGNWVGPVHEVWQIHGPAGELKESLLHFPHPNVAQFLEEINRYSSLRAQFLYRNAVKVRWWHIPAYPAAKFFVNYFWRLGFLDGTAGAVMAIMMSFHSFLVRAKLWQLHERET